MDGGGRRRELLTGFRFSPTEEELVSFYLNKKIHGNATQEMDRVIPQLDVYEFNPWELPQYAGEFCRGDTEQWFFFIPRQEKEARGGRPCRLTSSGYWKATGSPSSVYSRDNRVIGMKRTMVFYTGRAPTGKKTEWKMNEYKAIKEEASLENTNPPKLMQELSLCRLYIKSKCLRAFDRRPSATAPSESQTIQHTGESNVQATSSSHFDHQVLTERTKSSPVHSSNSSGEHATIPTDHTTMEIDSELSWDWEEHINWF